MIFNKAFSLLKMILYGIKAGPNGGFALRPVFRHNEIKNPLVNS